MGLSVSSRPEKTIQSPGNPYYTAGEFVSQWNSAWLPIEYKLSSNLFPVNNVDTTKNITGVSDNGGFADLAVASHGFNLGDYITVAGTSLYDGIHEIAGVPDANSIVIPIAYSATATGTVLKYYNNYQAKIKVYSGLPVTHPLSVLRPVQVVAEVALTPDENNEIRFDISPFVRDVIQDELMKSSEVNYPNDLDAWNSFYISYAESYDRGTSQTALLIERFTSGFTVDVDAEYLERIFYAVNGSQQYGYQYGGNFGEYVTSNAEGLKSSWLTEFTNPIIFRNGLRQDLSIIIDKELADAVSIVPPYIQYKNTDASGGTGGWQSIQLNVMGEGVYRIPIQNVFALETTKTTSYRALIGDGVENSNLTGTTTQTGLGNSWSVGSPLPVSVSSTGSKVLYLQSSESYPQGLAFVKVNVTTTSTAFLRVGVAPYSGSGNTSVQNLGITTNQDLFYTIDVDGDSFNSVTLEGGGSGTLTVNSLELYYIPVRTQTLNGISDCFSEYQEFPIGTTGKSFISLSPYFEDKSFGATNTYFDTYVNSVLAGITDAYYIEPTSSSVLPSIYSSSNVGNAYQSILEIEIVSGTLNVYQGLIGEFTQTGVNLTAGTYTLTATNTWITSDYPFVYIESASAGSEVNINSFIVVSVEKPITTCAAGCGRFSYYLTWLNKLGGWEFWEFYTDENVSFEVDDVRTVKNDRWINWDSGFIANERQYKRTGITVRKSQRIRSQYLNLEQIRGMESLKYSPQAYLITADGETPVQINAQSFQLYNTTDKLYQIEFEILFNDTIVQR